MSNARPTIVCLCGSSRFKQAFEQAARAETLDGKIVLTLCVFSQSDHVPLTAADHALLVELHRAKIAMADEVLVINPDGYMGEMTRSEVDYALGLGKAVRFLEPHRGAMVAPIS